MTLLVIQGKSCSFISQDGTSFTQKERENIKSQEQKVVNINRDGVSSIMSLMPFICVVCVILF